MELEVKSEECKIKMGLKSGFEEQNMFIAQYVSGRLKQQSCCHKMPVGSIVELKLAFVSFLIKAATTQFTTG